MSERPEFLVSGDEATLFPVLAETNKERRVASIFLAVATQVPALAEGLLSSVGVRVGQRTKVTAYTEVVLSGEIKDGCRPDGLIIVDTGRKRWSALVEAKIGRNCLQQDQVSKYVELARANGIDAVITISNEFASRPDHSPVSVSKVLLRKVGLFHWSWSWVATLCEILNYQEAVTDTEQEYLLRQLNQFLAHPGTGVERFAQKAASWKDVVQSVTNGDNLKKASPELEEAAASWISEERDLCLHLSSHIGQEVTTVLERKLVSDPGALLKSKIDTLTTSHKLKSLFRVPNCASDIHVCADLTRRTVEASMSVKAPTDKKTTKARVNWLLRMCPSDDEGLIVRAHWPGRGAATSSDLKALRENHTLIQNDNPDAAPHTFEVALVENLGKRFSGRKTFIEDVERVTHRFYDLVGANLKAWQAPPPKPIKPRLDEVEEEATSESVPIDE